MFRLKFDAPKGHRVHKGFLSVTVFDNHDHLWWSDSDKKWMKYHDINGPRSSHAPCRSVKAFKRMLRKNQNIIGHALLVHRQYAVDKNSKLDFNLDVHG